MDYFWYHVVVVAPLWPSSKRDSQVRASVFLLHCA
jgi:hypothetical protein